MARIELVYGAPFSGTLDYVLSKMGDNDIFYDFDTLMSSITGKPKHKETKNAVPYLLDMREALLRRAMHDYTIGTVYVTTTFLSRSMRELKESGDVRFVRMTATQDECYQHIGACDLTPEHREVLLGIVDEWYEKYGSVDAERVDKTNNPFYKTQRWRQKREHILRRDEYMCRECRRYGKTTSATTVHHIFPFENYPEYKLLTANLISVCRDCHESYHNRYTGKLTEKGLLLMERHRHNIVKAT